MNRPRILASFFWSVALVRSSLVGMAAAAAVPPAAVAQRADAPTPGNAPAAIDGLNMEELKRGNGPRAVAGDVGCVHYVGRLHDGTVIFDSKRVDGKPRRFTAGGNVRPQGLGRALVGAQAGAARIATIPPELAYGSTGLPASNIPPNAVIIYQFEVVEIRAKK